ncbi:YopX family protein [Paenibacillus qinlingensis]|uniref:Phage protein (TIGR01671 family) n=1 Tax=Paenibacillus qinlingensis TaxID=1837343 RepID=A0ABU1P6T3_9BACL|nr:YopX family protein [Paenibacillus qinlingensis]MDR6555470.1 putative phage protein (TIGR01671 family) [Paenibacillus qinlingensis]
MRQIKFRAWDINDKKWHTRVLVGTNCGHAIYDEERGQWFEFDEFCGTVVQFTGLQDRNGKDIYDEDILKFEYPVEIMDNGCHSIDGETIIMRVAFIQGCWIAKGKAVNYEFLLPLGEINLYELFEIKAYGKYPVKISVIGNTFENIELLEATP